MTDQVHEPQPIQAPVTIYCEDGLTEAFVVTEIGGWIYETLGIFATGCWQGFSSEEDVLIPYAKINYLKYDFDALREYAVQELAEATAPPAP